MRLGFFLTILSLLILCSGLSAQTSNEALIAQYTEEANNLKEAGNYTKAILFRKKALNLQQLASPPPYSDLVSNYRNIGYLYRISGKYKESREYQIRAEELAEEHLPETHPEREQVYNGVGGYYYSIQHYSQALEYFQKALDAGIRSNSANIANYYNNIGITQQALGNSGEALNTYNQSLDFNLQANGLYHFNTADNYKNFGNLFSGLNKFELALAYLDTSEMILDSVLPEGSIQFADIYTNLGAAHNKIGNNRKALHYLERSVKLHEKYGIENHPKIAYSYANIGLLVQKRGEYEKALAYFKKALAIRELEFGKYSPVIARTHFYLGNIYLDKLDFSKALEELELSLSLLESSQIPNRGDIADVRNSLGNYYKKMGNLNEALKQYDKAIRANSDNLNANDLDVANTYALMGKAYLLKNQSSKAKTFFQKALDIRYNVHGSNHASVAESYADLALACGYNRSCIERYISLAYRHINYDGQSADQFNKVRSPITLLKIMQAEGKLNLNLFEETSDTSFLFKADQTFETAIELINFIKTSLEQPSSRLVLQNNFYQIYENAILTKHYLKDKTGDTSFWNEAFKITEQSNAILLMEAIQSIDAEQFAGIPDSLLRLEREYKTQLSFLEKRLYEEESKKKSKDKAALKNINNSIFDIHAKQHELLDIFKKNHKEYFELKYKTKTVSVERIQNHLLRDDQTMISYFVGENKLFVFIISKTKFEMVQIEKNFPLKSWIEEFRKSIYNFNPADNNSAALNQKLANIGHELYQLIFEPAIGHISTESLIIIPGGVLGYLPFDALLSQPAEDYNDFDHFEYLIKKYNISYSFSATLLDEMMSGSHRKQPFIAFAPAYYGDTLNVNRSNDPWRAVLGQLRFNQLEAKNIHELMGGQIYLDKQATEAKFMEVASKAGILHLATHGKSNDHNGDYSYLAFFQTTDSIENELLFVKNLYEMDIPASLVVLSACETGIGELQRGEGIISLARGFSYAGAASIVTTLWSIDDNASATIMLDFYKNMKNGDPKDAALRKAKLAYIAKNKGNNRTHPLFWAAFVPMGNMETLGGNGFWWAVLLGSIACLSLLFIFYKKRKD